MKYLFLLYIILNPIFFLTNCDQRSAQEVFYQISGLLIFASSFFVPQKSLKFSKLHLWLGIMLIAFLAAWLRSTYGFQKIAFNFIVGLMVYITFIKTINKDDIKFLFKGIAWVGIAGMIYMAFQLIGTDLRGTANISYVFFGDRSGRVDANSFFFQNSAMGMYFAQIVPIIASINIYLAPFFLIPVIKSQCAIALVGGIAAYLFFLWFRKRMLFWIVLIPIILGGLYFGFTKENSTSLAIRLPVWKEVFQDICKQPLGQGLDSFYNGRQRYFQDIHTKKVYRAIRQGKEYKYFNSADSEFMKELLAGKVSFEDLETPHNEYLWMGYEVGLHSLVILGFIFYYIHDRFRKSMRDPITSASAGFLMAVAIFCIAQFPLHLSRIAHLLPIMGGIFYVVTEDS